MRIRSPLLTALLLIVAARAQAETLPGSGNPCTKARPSEEFVSNATPTIQAPIRPTTKPWPGGVIHYRFDPRLDPAFMVATRLAIAEFEQKTRLRFIEGLPKNGEGFLTIKHGPGTQVDTIGYGGDGTEQFMCFSPWQLAIWGVATHELGHVVGLDHEIQRCDRNNYVSIPDANGNNEMLCDSLTVGPYDTYSIMAYSEVEMHGGGSTPNAQSEFIPPHWTPPKGEINGLTETDLARIATLYGDAGEFAIVNVGTGKCLSAGSGNAIGPPRSRPTLRPCGPGTNQLWRYDPERRSLSDRQGRCLQSIGAYGDATLTACDYDNPNQRWAMGEHGFITAASMDANARDNEGVPICLGSNDSLGDPSEVSVVSRACADSDSARWVTHDFFVDPDFTLRGSLVSYAMVESNGPALRFPELCIGKRNGRDGLAKLQPCTTTSRGAPPRMAHVLGSFAGSRAHERQYVNDEGLCLGADPSEGALLSWRSCSQLGGRAWKRFEGKLFYVGPGNASSWCVVVDTPAGAPNSGHPGHEFVRPDWGLRLTSNCPAPWIAQPATMRWAFRDASTQPLTEATSSAP